MSPLILLVLFSLLATGGVAFLLHRLGFSRTGIFANEEAAATAFLTEFPEFAIDRIGLAVDGNAAIMALANTPALGIVHTMGKYSVAKTIAPGDVSSCNLKSRQLKLHIRDFADPVFHITLATEEEARAWAVLFEDAQGAASHA